MLLLGAGGVTGGLPFSIEGRGEAASRVRVTRSFYLMGTRVMIEAVGPDGLAGVAVEEAYAELERIDRLMSTFRPESELSRFNRHPSASRFTVSPRTARVLEEALRLAEATGGAFDPTVGPLMRLWTIREGGAPLPPPRQQVWATLGRVGYHHLSLDSSRRMLQSDRPGVELDLGAIAKGYGVDRAVTALRRVGAVGGLVDLGQSSMAFWGVPRRVAIRHPLDPSQIIARFDIDEGSVSTSAGYERGFEIDGRWYSHIIDPRTGAPVQGSLSATVVGDVGEAMKVDGLSTAGFVLGPEGALQIWQSEAVEGILFFRKGKKMDFVATPGFPLETTGIE